MNRDHDTTEQFSLFGHISAAYAEAPSRELDTEVLYTSVAKRAGIDASALDVKVPIGAAGELYNPLKRKIRWYQQTLKQLGIIERVPGKRGIWRLAHEVEDKINRARPGVRLVAFGTDLGAAIWANSKDVFPFLGEPIHLLYSSFPYPLRNPRAYGGPTEANYVDFACDLLEPVVRSLAPGGSIVLNLSNDIFEPGSPARSLYLERLTIALHDRLGLKLMDRYPWVNYSKPPGPTYWACVEHVHMSSAWEPIRWFTNDPQIARTRADNRRILEPHTERHKQMMEAGGCKRNATYGDGAYKLREHSFGRMTEGKLPRNVIERGHYCPDTIAFRAHAKRLGLPPHGATQPTDLPDKYIRFLTSPGDLVVDTCGGTGKTGLAAQRQDRRWLLTEWILQYLRTSGELFRDFTGYWMHPAVAAMQRTALRSA